MKLVQPGCRIPKETWDKFKNAVKEKHGITSGVTSIDMAKALDFFVAHGMPDDINEPVTEIQDPPLDSRKEIPHTHTKPEETSIYHGSSINKSEKLLLKYDETFVEHETILPNFLNNWVMKEMEVKDKRAIQGYVNYLEANNRIFNDADLGQYVNLNKEEMGF